MPDDWWWGIAGSVLGTVLSALALAVLVEGGIWLAPHVERLAERLHPVRARVQGLAIGTAVGLGVFGFRVAQAPKFELSWSEDPAATAIFLAMIAAPAVLGLLAVIHLISRLMRRLDRREPEAP